MSDEEMHKNSLAAQEARQIKRLLQAGVTSRGYRQTAQEAIDEQAILLPE